MNRTMIVLMLCAGALVSPAMGADPAALAKAKQCFTLPRCQVANDRALVQGHRATLQGS